MGPHDHPGHDPTALPKSPILRALDAMNLADHLLRQHPTDANIVLEWWEARRRWMRVVEEAKSDG